MSYEKQTWVTGDTITAAKLNHMEDGIAAGSSWDFKYIYDEADSECSASGLPFDDLLQMALNAERINACFVVLNGSSVSTGVPVSIDGDSGEGSTRLVFTLTAGVTVEFYEDNTGYDSMLSLSFDWQYDSATGEYTITPSDDGGEE